MLKALWLERRVLLLLASRTCSWSNLVKLWWLHSLQTSTAGFILLLADSVLTLVGDVIFIPACSCSFKVGLLLPPLFGLFLLGSDLVSIFFLLDVLVIPKSSTLIILISPSVSHVSSCHTTGWLIVLLLQLLRRVILLVLAGVVDVVGGVSVLGAGGGQVLASGSLFLTGWLTMPGIGLRCFLLTG